MLKRYKMRVRDIFQLIPSLRPEFLGIGSPERGMCIHDQRRKMYKRILRNNLPLVDIFLKSLSCGDRSYALTLLRRKRYPADRPEELLDKRYSDTSSVLFVLMWEQPWDQMTSQERDALPHEDGFEHLGVLTVHVNPKRSPWTSFHVYDNY